MEFTSLPFLLFLPAVFLIHFLAGDLRWLVLLLASVAFCAALGSPVPLLALALVSVTSYVLARVIGSSAGGKRTAAFWGGVGLNLGVLVVARYGSGLGSGGTPWVSVGVSYFVFQAISYLADVHLGVLEPEPHLGRLAESLAFFPKLLQGPIERTGHLLPQLRAPYRFDAAHVRAGLLQFGVGLFRKVVIADRLALFVDAAYGRVATQTGATLVLATYAYAFQIYFDFAGYTDMALGAARIFGVRLTPNFRSPYSATSVADFWRRWHVSFSSWILDYVFKPLQMLWRRQGTLGTAGALLVTFAASGVWHGAAWNYVVWGLLHGTYMAVEALWRPYRKRFVRWLRFDGTPVLLLAQRAVTFNLVSLAWVFFRAPTLSDARMTLARMATPGMPRVTEVPFLREHVATLAGALVLERALAWSVSEDGHRAFVGWPGPARWLAYVTLGYACLVFGTSARGFVYQGF